MGRHMRGCSGSYHAARYSAPASGPGRKARLGVPSCERKLEPAGCLACCLPQVYRVAIDGVQGQPYAAKVLQVGSSRESQQMFIQASERLGLNVQ